MFFIYPDIGLKVGFTFLSSVFQSYYPVYTHISQVVAIY
jgi:hypothetical protein